ncbi:transglycosylase SLT domain-containing protein [uncultured Shewanella sp.]|uniref:transglycosylase SLT domain-containing protein n=1 Tax=uncultured Shewanella sp. TaxID=173975 RepID=UPI0026369991|nr:transglycosylase SLT domain-containing protein [uncultured Shewanella sp.]
MTKLFFIKLFSLFFTIGLSFSSVSQTFTQDQENYLAAKKALEKKQKKRYQTLRAKLDGYPLHIYLDYQSQKDTLSELSGKQALTIINQWKNTPLYNRARGRYLSQVGKVQRWDDFLVISPTAPNNIALQCYFFRAQLAKNQPKIAYTGAKALWQWGQSRPEACDPLFSAWMQAGQLTQELIWTRMKLAFTANQYSLLQYLSKQLTLYPTEAKQLLDIYKRPSQITAFFILDTSLKDINYLHEDILFLGLKKLSKRHTAQALWLFSRYQTQHAFTAQKAHQLQLALIKRALIIEDNNLKESIDSQLPIIANEHNTSHANKIVDDLLERRIRWAIKDRDWEQANRYIDLLSQTQQNNPRWIYWRARLLQYHNAQSKMAKKLLDELSQQRHFYGYLAALQQNKPFQLQHQSTPSLATLRKKLHQDLGLARVTELMTMNNIPDARSEWLLLLNRHSQAMQQEYALFALEQRWFNLSIETSIKAKVWNDMDLRFPYAAASHFEKASSQQQIDIDELRAIARRESAFNPYATSHAGAKGYMQLMPNTAKSTAKKENVNYRSTYLYDEAMNIQLGSAYYAQLKNDFDQNRILAVASYNAGPNRVKKWLDRSQGQLDAISFIETIPYKETREYVQALLSYRVIYQLKQNQQPDFLSQAEIEFQY